MKNKNYETECAANRVKFDIASKIIESINGRVYFNPKSLSLCADLEDGRTAEFKNEDELLEYAQTYMRAWSRLRSKKPEIYNKGLEDEEKFFSKFHEKK